MQKKQIIEFLIGLFVAIIFITSYVSLTNYTGSSQSSTTTIINAETIYASGNTNAMITGYSPIISTNVGCKNSTLANSTESLLTNSLTNMENNNTVSNFYSVGTKFIIDSGTMPSPQVYTYLSGRIAPSAYNCTQFSGTADISLPPFVTMKVESQSLAVAIPPTQQNSTIAVNFTRNMEGSMPVHVASLIYANGTVASQLIVTKAS